MKIKFRNLGSRFKRKSSKPDSNCSLLKSLTFKHKRHHESFLTKSHLKNRETNRSSHELSNKSNSSFKLNKTPNMCSLLLASKFEKTKKNRVKEYQMKLNILQKEQNIKINYVQENLDLITSPNEKDNDLFLKPKLIENDKQEPPLKQKRSFESSPLYFCINQIRKLKNDLINSRSTFHSTNNTEREKRKALPKRICNALSYKTITIRDKNREKKSRGI